MSVSAAIETAFANRADPNRKIARADCISYELQGFDQTVAVGSNTIITANQGDRQGIKFTSDAQNCTVIVGNILTSKFRALISGNDHLIYLGHTKKFQGQITIRGNRNLLFFSDYGTCNNAAYILSGNDKSIILGTDCMLSFLITIRSSDSHGIISLEKRLVINEAKSVLIHPHVWIGERAQILKGVTIGKGSIIGANATVASDVPPNSIAAGTPARVLVSDTTWHRKENPTTQEIDELFEALNSTGSGEKSVIGNLREKLFGKAAATRPAFPEVDEIDMEGEGGIGERLYDE